MKIAVSGWGRDMGETAVGDFPLREVRVQQPQSAVWSWDQPSASSNSDSLTVRWRSSLRLTGDYRASARLTNEDIVFLFKLHFGSKITKTIVDRCKFEISEEVLRIYLKQMTLDQLFDLIRGPKQDAALRQSANILSINLDEFELSARASNCLKAANILFVGDLVRNTEEDLLRTPNFGRRSVNEIKEILAPLGLKLGMKVDDPRLRGLS